LGYANLDILTRLKKIVIQQLSISTLNLPALEKINLVRGYISMYPSRQPKYGWMWEKKGIGQDS